MQQFNKHVTDALGAILNGRVLLSSRGSIAGWGRGSHSGWSRSLARERLGAQMPLELCDGRGPQLLVVFRTVDELSDGLTSDASSTELGSIVYYGNVQAPTFGSQMHTQLCAYTDTDSLCRSNQ